jgi:hypothetical protein
MKRNDMQEAECSCGFNGVVEVLWHLDGAVVISEWQCPLCEEYREDEDPVEDHIPSQEPRWY